jgi:hypothetical protein
MDAYAWIFAGVLIATLAVIALREQLELRKIRRPEPERSARQATDPNVLAWQDHAANDYWRLRADLKRDPGPKEFTAWLCGVLEQVHRADPFVFDGFHASIPTMGGVVGGLAKCIWGRIKDVEPSFIWGCPCRHCEREPAEIGYELKPKWRDEVTA